MDTLLQLRLTSKTFNTAASRLLFCSTKVIWLPSHDSYLPRTGTESLLDTIEKSLAAANEGFSSMVKNLWVDFAKIE